MRADLRYTVGLLDRLFRNIVLKLLELVATLSLFVVACYLKILKLLVGLDDVVERDVDFIANLPRALVRPLADGDVVLLC